MTNSAQAGVFSGLNPVAFNSDDPVVLFIIQATIILVFCRVIAIPLGYLKQPKVISEVIAGIVLGPTVMGRIPGFQDTIFPKESLPFINLIATIGLIFFLFQVGLEVDLHIIRQDWHKSVAVAIAGMGLPFGLGIISSLGLYKLQDDPSISFSSFLLFLGVSMAITAFPVLARILAELKLLRTKVGAVTMASGLINDCTAWVLLALVVALMNSSGGIEALYVFLTAVGFSLFMIFLVRPFYKKLCVATDSFENGPSHFLMTITLVMVLLSAFITNIIGVHAIFGGFLAGIVIPHENNLPMKITEKIEDIVNIIFLPLYFTLSGLKTQIGLLNSGIVWGYVVLVIVLACFGKIIGCTVAAKLTGMTTRESFTVGFLMNCKGLVELIVLNIGHDAGVLNDQVFVIMVVMALVTTIMTTPFVGYLYPEWYQKQTNVHLIDADFTTDYSEKQSIEAPSSINESDKYRIITMLNRVESVPCMMALIQLFKKHDTSHIELHALRLLELTQRTSAVMKVKDLSESRRQDPILNVLQTFAVLNGMTNLYTHFDVCPITEFVKTIGDYGYNMHADMILLPWTRHDFIQEYTDQQRPNEIDFMNTAFSIHHSHVGVFIDKGFGHMQEGDVNIKPHIVVIYNETLDSRAALLFGFQLQKYRNIDLTIVEIDPDIHDSSQPMYATQQDILTFIENDQSLSINDLFLSEKKIANAFNIVYHKFCQFEESRIIQQLKRPLNKHDLIILGRNKKLTSYSSISSAISTQRTYEEVLGPECTNILKDDNNQTSMLVIQARILSTI